MKTSGTNGIGIVTEAMCEGFHELGLDSPTRTSFSQLREASSGSPWLALINTPQSEHQVDLRDAMMAI